MVSRLAMLAGAGLLGGCAGLGSTVDRGPEPRFEAEIRRTAYGVPHVTAPDYGGLGYGLGYASAQDNLCMILDRVLTVRGERALYFGPGEDQANIAQDLHHRRINAQGEVERLLAGPSGDVDTPSEDARDFVSGFVAGVNRHIAETGPEGVTDPACAGADYIQPVSELDYWRTVLTFPYIYQLEGLVTAAPPEAGPIEEAALHEALPEPSGLGSNAYGLGRELTKNGRGMVLGNPHYPWDGPLRFYRLHMMIPGELNVVGAGLITAPIVGIGHTEHVAWSHTVSTARRFGYFELTLDPQDPTRYRRDGEWEEMTAREITVEVRQPDGSVVPVTRTLYETPMGALVETDTLPWTSERAFAMRDVPSGLRLLDQYFAIYQAESVRELREALGAYQATLFNTTSADSSGETFFGDMGMIPHVTAEKAASCAASDLARGVWMQTRVPVLDGSRSECDWGTDPDSTAPGVFGPASQPQLFRTDYVAQSNDSHWLTNPEAPLTGFSPVFGDEETQRSLRTRLALDIIAQREAGTDGYGAPGFDLETLQTAMYNNRHLGGELVRDDLVSLCRSGAEEDMQPACDALAGWDLKVDLDSTGSHLFNLFAFAGGIRFADAFDAENAAVTPAQLDVNDPAVLEALAQAAGQLRQLDIALDARLGDVQSEYRGEERIPIHGGPGGPGVFNVITPVDLEPERGWTSIRHGASWVYAVEFTDEGPQSRGILTYSQSTDPTSPHFADQTRLYSRKGWDDLLFTPEEVEAATVSMLTISE